MNQLWLFGEKKPNMKKTPIIIVLALGLSINIGAQNIKSKKTEATLVNYPEVVLENVNYENLSIVYAQETDPGLTGKKTVQKTKNICVPRGGKLKDAKELETFYYQFETILPANIILARDEMGRVVYALEEKEKYGTQSYAEKECYFMEAILESTYKSKKEYIDSLMLARISKAGPEWAFYQMNEALNFKYYTQKVDINYLDKGRGDHIYPELQQAMEDARKAYEFLGEDFNHPDATAYMELAIKVWEEDLAQADLDDKDARINEKIAEALAENLVYAYFFTKQFEKALEKADFANQKLNVKFGNFASNIFGIRQQIEEYKENEAKHGNINLLFPSKQIEYSLQTENNTRFASLLASAEPYFAEKARKEAALKSQQQQTQATALLAGWEMAEEEAANSPLTVLGKYGPVMMVMDDYSLKITKPIEEIPSEIYEFSDVLIGLTIKDNKLVSIPADIKQLGKLKKLDLSGNQITELPIELGELRNLKTLTLKGCPLKSGEVEKIQDLLPKKCKVKL